MPELKQLTIRELQPVQFEHAFSKATENLTGSDAEKAAYRQMAQLWFNRGYVFALQSARMVVEIGLEEIQQAERQ